MRGVFAAAGVLAVLVGGAAAQDAVTYKRYAYKVGDKTRTVKTQDNTGVTTYTANGKEQTKSEKRKKSLTYVTEVLVVGDDPTRPAKLRRVYEKATEESDGVETKLPLDGLTIVIEKKGDAYTFGTYGIALKATAAADLDTEFNNKGSFGSDLYPAQAIKPGDTWDLTERFLKELDTPTSSFVFAPKGAVATGKLLTSAKKGAAVFGDMEMTADLPLTELRGKQPVKLNPGSTWKITTKGSGCLDGTSPDSGVTTTMKIALDGEVKGVVMKVENDLKLTSRTERVGGAKP